MRRVWAIEAPSKDYLLCCDNRTDAENFFASLSKKPSLPFEVLVLTPEELDRIIGDREVEE